MEGCVQCWGFGTVPQSLGFPGTTTPVSPSHADFHPTSISGIPVELVFPSVSACMQHFGKEAALTGQLLPRGAYFQRALLAGTFMSCGRQRGEDNFETK